MARVKPLRRIGRPHKIPPAPGWRADLDLLEELERERLLGLALWEGLRDVALWVRVDADSRSGLFHPQPSEARAYAAEARAAAPELVDAWRGLDAVARAPGEVVRDTLVGACHAVYAWAEERAFLQTAAHFAEAAALVKPDASALANLAARTCRRAGLPTRAGPWYQRGRALAVRAQDFDQKFSASVGYGWLMYALGRYDRARRIMNRAATSALK